MRASRTCPRPRPPKRLPAELQRVPLPSSLRGAWLLMQDLVSVPRPSRCTVAQGGRRRELLFGQGRWQMQEFALEFHSGSEHAQERDFSRPRNWKLSTCAPPNSRAPWRAVPSDQGWRLLGPTKMEAWVDPSAVSERGKEGGDKREGKGKGDGWMDVRWVGWWMAKGRRGRGGRGEGWLRGSRVDLPQQGWKRPLPRLCHFEVGDTRFGKAGCTHSGTLSWARAQSRKHTPACPNISRPSHTCGH